MRILRLLLFFFLLVAGFAGRAEHDGLCPGIIFKEGFIDLSKNEEILVCGSKKSPEAWQSVPLPQAQYELNVLLQSRGFLNARFERQGQTLFVWSGPLTKVRSLHVLKGRDYLNPHKKRKIVGYPLTPAKLDEVKGWAERSLRRQGFPCATVEVTAQAWDGAMMVNAETGTKKRIGAITRHGLGRLDEEALRRFEAFDAGDDYDVVDTTITTNRMLAQGLFQSAYFTTKCREEEVDLNLFMDVGKPRVLRFGVGASTEEFPFFDAWFRNSRLDDRASSLTAFVHASPIKQEINVSSELYVIPFSKRTYLGPRFDIERRKERAYEIYKAEVGADVARAWDIAKKRIVAAIGPTLTYEKTVVGVGPSDAKYLSWRGSLNAMNHNYEAFIRDQFEGWTGNLTYVGQRKGIGSEINVDRYDLGLKYLWNINSYSPPLFVLATRLNAAAVASSEVNSTRDSEVLPVGYRIFYGGDENLRGFARESLNNSQLGYLTVLHAGAELRWVEVLPYRLEPFLLADVARLGVKRFSLSRPLFVSSGLGLRWASPFGTLRGSIARGQIWSGDETTDYYPQEWVYFVSFGKEF